MASSVLSSIVKTDKETKVNLEQINGTLDKMYKLQVKTAKDDAAHKKRLEQQAKRKSGDRLGSLMGTNKQEAKKEKKGFLSKLGDIFGGVLGGLTAAGLFKALGLASLGGIIIGYFKSPQFRKFVNDIILKPMWNAIKNGLIGENGIFGAKNRDKAWNWIKENPLKTLGLAATGMAALIGPKSTLGLAFSGLTKVVPMILQKLGAFLGLKIGGTTLGMAGAGLVGAPLALAAAGGAVQRQIRVNQGGGGAAGDLYADSQEEIGRLQAKTKNKRGRKVRDLEGDDQKRLELLLKVSEEIRKSTEIKDKQIKESRTFDRQKKRYIYDEDKRMKAEEAHQKRVEAIRAKNKLQNGGPVRVPGSGSGDKVPMMLPSGSFVMNREASRFQSGGMVPTLLEPGEKVYGPGQWGAHHMMMNSAIPRFQSGGPVQANHPDTGPGWSIGLDYKGRPSVFTRTAAKALMEAMAASGGLVKTSDITSSQRSPSKNAAVGGVANSNHLTGNAVDIHGTSKAWLKANGMQYGWKNLVYGGHDGHFDFTKGMGGYQTASGDGRENTADSDSQMGGGNKNILSAAMSGIGVAGKYLKATFDVFNEVFGPDIASLLGFGGGASAGQTSSQASSGPASDGGPSKEFKDFVRMGKAAGAKYPELVAAQWALESGYGKTLSGKHNYFGIKAAKGEAGTNKQTWEHIGGQDITTTAKFKDFDSPQAAVNHLVNQWHKNYKSYSGVNNASDAYAAADMLRQQGYATDPAYSSKLKKIMKQNGYQSGGAVHMQSTASSSAMARRSEDNFIQRMSQAMSPVVIPIPTGGAGGGVTSSAPTPAVPSLPSNPHNTAALDLAYRLSMGASFA